MLHCFRPTTLALALLLGAGAAQAADAPADAAPLANGSSAPLPLDELRTFAEVLDRVKAAYVEPVDDKTLLENAIKGMLSNLDPHSAYLGPEDFAEPAGKHQRRVRRPGHRGRQRRRLHQGGLADRRHPGGPRRHPARRPYRADRRQADQGPVDDRGGRQHARQGRLADHPDHRPRRRPAVRCRAQARHHQGQERQEPGPRTSATPTCASPSSRSTPARKWSRR